MQIREPTLKIQYKKGIKEKYQFKKSAKPLINRGQNAAASGSTHMYIPDKRLPH